MKETNDEILIAMLKDPLSREKGFLLLIERYKESIYWHIRRLVVSHHDAEDILQETFIQVYRFAASFKGESKLSTWLYRIACNECIAHFRRNKNKFNKGLSLKVHLTDQLSETDMGSSEAILVKFQQAIHLLPEKQRIIFNLRYYDELSYEDIGKILNSSVNSLKTNYHYACAKIRKFLIENA